jgi:hypothetical protein
MLDITVRIADNQSLALPAFGSTRVNRRVEGHPP